MMFIWGKLDQILKELRKDPVVYYANQEGIRSIKDGKNELIVKSEGIKQIAVSKKWLANQAGQGAIETPLEISPAPLFN